MKNDGSDHERRGPGATDFLRPIIISSQEPQVQLTDNNLIDFSFDAGATYLFFKDKNDEQKPGNQFGSGTYQTDATKAFLQPLSINQEILNYTYLNMNNYSQ